MKTSESFTKVAAALVAAQAEMGDVAKDAKNPFFKSNYATLNAVREASMPFLSKHKLSIIQPLVTKDNKQYVETVILHESGEYIMGEMEVTAKPNANAQEIGSSVSYSRRYSLMSILNLAASDDDGNSASGKEEVKAPAPPMKQEKPTFSRKAVKPTEDEI